MSVPGIASILILLTILVPLTVSADFISQWGEWMPWSPCPVTCGYGSIQKVQYWFDEKGQKTNETYVLHSTCYVDVKCKIDGNWTMWSPFSACSAVCGPGKRKQTRSCTNPRPDNGGKDCFGPSDNYTDCNLQECPPIPKDFNIKSCAIGEKFNCTSKQMCVEKTERCDRKVQCNDGSDEYLCYRYVNEMSGLQISKTVLTLWTLFLFFSFL